jgi:hypothetical protein
MLRQREGIRLPAWLDTAAASGIGDLVRFAHKALGYEVELKPRAA